jgi:hypothetical protein
LVLQQFEHPVADRLAGAFECEAITMVAAGRV